MLILLMQSVDVDKANVVAVEDQAAWFKLTKARVFNVPSKPTVLICGGERERQIHKALDQKQEQEQEQQ